MQPKESKATHIRQLQAPVKQGLKLSKKLSNSQQKYESPNNNSSLNELMGLKKKYQEIIDNRQFKYKSRDFRIRYSSSGKTQVEPKLSRPHILPLRNTTTQKT